MSQTSKPTGASASLTISAEAVLRSLESWTQIDDLAVQEEPNEDKAVVAAGMLDVELKLKLTAVSRNGTLSGSVPHAPVTSQYELEAFVFDAGKALRARSQAPHVRELSRLRAQQDCCEELSRRSTLTLAQLQVAAEECARVKCETTPMLATSEAQVRRRQEEEALAGRHRQSFVKAPGWPLPTFMRPPIALQAHPMSRSDPPGPRDASRRRLGCSTAYAPVPANTRRMPPPLSRPWPLQANPTPDL